MILPVHKFIDIALKYNNENKTNIPNIIEVIRISMYQLHANENKIEEISMLNIFHFYVITLYLRHEKFHHSRR